MLALPPRRGGSLQWLLAGRLRDRGGTGCTWPGLFQPYWW